MPALSVFLNDTIDITEYVHSRPVIVDEMPNFGQLMVSGITSLEVVNKWGWADVNNPASPFYGYATLEDFTITIKQDDETIYTGVVDQVIKDGQLGTIEMEPTLQKVISKKCIFASDEISNPARIFRRICELYKIPYDSNSVNVSESIYELDEVRCSAYLLNPDMDIASVFQSLCDVGIARIYSYRNLFYFEAYQDIELIPVFTISSVPSNPGNYLIQPPVISNLPRDPFVGYEIETTQGNATYQKGTGTMQSINAGNDSEVRINTLQSAVVIGERWIEYAGLSQKQVDFIVPAKTLGRELQLGYPVSVYDADSQSTIDVEIRYIEQTDTVVTTCQGVSR